MGQSPRPSLAPAAPPGPGPRGDCHRSTFAGASLFLRFCGHPQGHTMADHPRVSRLIQRRPCVTPTVSLGEEPRPRVAGGSHPRLLMKFELTLRCCNKTPDAAGCKRREVYLAQGLEVVVHRLGPRCSVAAAGAHGEEAAAAQWRPPFPPGRPQPPKPFHEAPPLKGDPHFSIAPSWGPTLEPGGPWGTF